MGAPSDDFRAHQVVDAERADQHARLVDHQHAGDPVLLHQLGRLRRQIETGADLRALTAADVMHPGPRTLRADALAAEAAELMEQHRITSVLVIDAAGVLIGALSINDLMRAKVI